MKNLKKIEIDYLNIFFCICVVGIHLLAPAITQVNKDTWQYIIIFIPWRLASFVVPGFILISAIKTFSKYKKNSIYFKKFLKNRVEKILIPYIIFVVIYYLYFIFKGDLIFDVGELIKYILTGTLVSPFYFIIIIFQFYLLLPLWNKVFNNFSPIIIIPLSILGTLLFKKYIPDILNIFNIFKDFEYNDRIFTTYLMYWVIGGYIGKNYEYFTNMLKDNSKLIILQGIIMTILELIFGIMQFSKGIYIPFLESIHEIYVLTTILFLYLSSIKINKKYVGVKIIKYINKSSYIIYLSHSLFIFVVNSMLNYWGVKDIALGIIVRSICVYGMIIVMSYIIGNYYDYRCAR